MNVTHWLFLFVLSCCASLAAENKPDFIPADILAKDDGFVYIKLQNRSNTAYQAPAALKEKVFLTIYIDNIKRAEYKLKYIQPKLFQPRGTIFFRTNFRMQPGLRLKVEVNRLKVIPESNFSNNTLTKQPAGQ